jgi:hypothetical protein
MTIHDLRIRVLRLGMPDLTLFLLGTAKTFGKRTVFVRTDFVEGLKTGMLALRQFRTVRKVNKIHREIRKSRVF